MFLSITTSYISTTRSFVIFPLKFNVIFQTKTVKYDALSGQWAKVVVNFWRDLAQYDRNLAIYLTLSPWCLQHIHSTLRHHRRCVLFTLCILHSFASIHWHLHVYASFMVYAICGNRSVDSIFLSLLFSYVIFWLYFIFCNSIFVRGFAVSLLVSIKQVSVWFKGCLNGQCFVQQFWLTHPACVHWPGIWFCIISHKFWTWTNDLICCLQTNNLAETLF